MLWSRKVKLIFQDKKFIFYTLQLQLRNHGLSAMVCHYQCQCHQSWVGIIFFGGRGYNLSATSYSHLGGPANPYCFGIAFNDESSSTHARARKKFTPSGHCRKRGKWLWWPIATPVFASAKLISTFNTRYFGGGWGDTLDLHCVLLNEKEWRGLTLPPII